jgi:hypothetical protein
LVAQGRIARLAQGNLADLGPPPPRAEGEPSLSEILDELREDRF